MSLRRILPLLAVLLCAVACGRGGGVTGTEQEDADFLRAQDLKKRDLYTEALAAYLKVIGRFGEQAPESHLDAGLIYFQRVKDPFKGWYYLQRYLELQPASPRRDEIRQQVTAAEREMIFQRLAQAQFGGGELVQLQEQVDQLTRENARLEAELKMIREAPSGVVTRSEIMLAPVTNASAPIAVGPAAGSASPSGQINLSPTAAVPQAAIVMSPPGAAKSTPPAEPKGTTATRPRSAPTRCVPGRTYLPSPGSTTTATSLRRGSRL
jgi:hypothetical protein